VTGIDRDRRLADSAALCDRAADALEQAAAHCRTAAGHFRDGEVSGAAAHAWAAHGQLLRATEHLAEQAREHADRSNP
jgi:hypothetical protein